MQAEAWRPEAPHVPVAVGHRMGGDALAGPPVPVDELRGHGRRSGKLVQQSEPCELPCGVARDADRGADLGQLGRLFEHLGPYSALAQREREGQAPDPGADDRNSRFCCAHEPRA